MLVDLHDTLRSYPGELPMLAPAVNDIPLGLAALGRATDVFSAAEIGGVRAAAERLRPFLEAPNGPTQPLHGDVHPGNLIPTRDGLVWIDFEEVCRGPIEWDLGLMDMYDAADTIDAHHRADPDTLARCTDLRRLHVGLCLVAFRDDLGDVDGWDDGIRHFLGPFISTS